MNRRPDQHDRLLAEALHDGWADGPGAAFARQAAALVRRRRRVQRLMLAAGTAAAVALVFASSLFRAAPERSQSPSRPHLPAYEVISDEQLLAQLGDRPLLVLPKENGAREFVLLDRPAEGP